jgi:hypothetical protein
MGGQTGDQSMVKKTAAKPAAEKAAGEVTKLPAPTAGDTGAESAPPVADNPPVTDTANGEGAASGATASTESAAPVTEAVTGQLDGAPHGDTGTRLEVIEGAGGVVTADPDSEIEGQQAVRISGWVIECKRRDRGLWRAGRFWPPEPTAVPADELTDDQLQALLAEPLLTVIEVE